MTRQKPSRIAAPGRGGQIKRAPPLWSKVGGRRRGSPGAASAGTEARCGCSVPRRLERASAAECAGSLRLLDIFPPGSIKHGARRVVERTLRELLEPPTKVCAFAPHQTLLRESRRVRAPALRRQTRCAAPPQQCWRQPETAINGLWDAHPQITSAPQVVWCRNSFGSLGGVARRTSANAPAATSNWFDINLRERRGDRPGFPRPLFVRASCNPFRGSGCRHPRQRSAAGPRSRPRVAGRHDRRVELCAARSGSVPMALGQAFHARLLTDRVVAGSGVKPGGAYRGGARALAVDARRRMQLSLASARSSSARCRSSAKPDFESLPQVMAELDLIT